MSFAPQVIADRSGKWNGNSLRFATEAEAKDYVVDLAGRWTLVTDVRVIEVNEPVTAHFENGVTELIKESTA